MMKKILGSLLASSALIGFGIQANAAVSVGTNGQVTSDATINVKQGEAVPTTPENPDTPPGETGQKGPLSLDNVITFNFQDMNLSGGTQNVSLKNDGTESIAKRNIQITDTRGTGAGWNLQIKQSELTDTTTSSTARTLTGAYITLSNGLVVPGSGNAATTSAYPSINNYDVNSSNKGQFAKLITADKDQGLGTFKVYYNQDKEGTIKNPSNDIQLVVPAGNYIGSYKGTVTWALSDSPTSNPA